MLLSDSIQLNFKRKDIFFVSLFLYFFISFFISLFLNLFILINFIFILEPWYLLGSIIIGGYVGANITQWGETAKRVSAERRAERGLPPFTLN